MIEKLLASCLGPVLAAEKQLRQRQLVITLLGLGAIGSAALTAVFILTQGWSWPLVLGFFGLLGIASLIGLIRLSRRTPDLREIARRIEESHPDLRTALLAAMDQKPGPDGELGFLQRRLFGEISAHAVKHRWVRKVSSSRLATAAWGQFAAIVLFVASLWFLLGEAPLGAKRPAVGNSVAVVEETGAPAEIELTVTPGDVELEKGSRLVIEATFTGRAPATAQLIHRHAGGETRIPMQVGLDDTVFSTLIPKIDTDGTYHLLYENTESDAYSITTFEYPELSRSDAVVTPPDYLGREPETIADTRKITVMEGSTVEWKLRVNKPVAAGELFGEDGEIVSLTPDPADATLLTASHTPPKTQKYRVHLVDEKDRANQRPPWLTVNVKENLPPKLKLTFPGRDFEVSALQELPLEAEVWDDVEVLRTGLTYQFRGEETQVVLSDEALPGNTDHPLSTLIDIEALKAKERDLVTYFFWAEDRDKEGKVRFTASDRFFAEVRLFEEIVREGAAGGGQGGTPPGGDAGELIRIQKDVINAAWKLVRDHQSGKPFASIAPDVSVIHESQSVVIGMVDEVLQKVEDPSLRTLFEEAKALMERSAAAFVAVTEKEDGDLLPPAHDLALEVYAKLIEARARETEISMSKSQSPSASESQQQKQQNMNLELEQKELKYEEQSTAESPTQTAEQKENLAVLNRLKDLARRQEAIAEKIKELENQLQKANPDEKAEIERQLKRLQEEQRELLRELDDLAEKMESEENRANMAEEREELGETRESVQETAEKLESGDLADAANAATRAGEKLEEMKEEFREKTSRQFTNEMKSLRDDSRELAEKQESIGEQLDQLAEAPQGDPFSKDLQKERAELAQAMAEQSEQLEKVLETMRTLSEQAEPTEPLLSDALYETVRNATMNEIGESLQEAQEMTFYNRADQARSAEEAASRGIEDLKDRVEKAAEKILGNEADALRLARSELDKLIEETQSETERLASKEGTQEGQAADPTGSDQEKVEAASRRLAEGKEKGEGEGKTPGEPGKGEGKGESELASKGKGEGKGETPGEGQEKVEPGELAEKGSQPGPGQQPGVGQEGKEKGKGKGKGEGEGENSETGDSPGQGNSERLSMGGGNSGGGGALNNGGDDQNEGRATGGGLFFDESTEQREPGPITGEDYEPWSDRLANLEEMLPQDDLRNAVAQVRDDARAMRIDYRRDDLPPGAATIQQKITEPLVELRQRLGEELAKLNRENPVSPIDRDPVPSEFRDLVRRYYEELGAGD